MKKIFKALPSLIKKRSTQIEVPWYLAGGVPIENCVAAYQAIGAESYEASKVNLANPGTHDLTDGVAPAFNTATGWTFDGATTYLQSDISSAEIGHGTGSFLVRYSDLAERMASHTILGAAYYGAEAEVIVEILITNSPGITDSLMLSYFGYLLASDPSGLSASYFDNYQEPGVICLSGLELFYNGVTTSQFTTGWTAGAAAFDCPVLPIGAGNYDGLSNYVNGKMQALAFYNTVLTAEQVSAITTAMQAL